MNKKMVNSVAGIYNKADFFAQIEKVLQYTERNRWYLMAIDIEHFKLFNEWNGKEAGDQFLTGIVQGLHFIEEQCGGIAGYLGEDDFGILLPGGDEQVELVQQKVMECVRKNSNSAGFFPAFGVYPIKEEDMSVSAMYDRAVIALSHVKGNYVTRVCWYDSSMIEKMEEEHFLLSEVQRALEEGEFTFYAQPQCNMATGKIVGAESLIRWNHKTKGLVPPGEFVPILEKNGFIADLDRYVWKEVCKWLRSWIDRGHKPIPVSVNVSRVDIYSMDVVKYLHELIDTYQLEPRLIEVEITESTYAEDADVITNLVDELRKDGFLVLMDDFGSGYSSLNMLKDVNVDVLKIDMKFLEMSEQSKGKGVGIIEAVVNMARLMDMRIIVEGVESREQMDYLLEMGGYYGQGYYFYRPLPVTEFENLLHREENLDFAGIQVKKLERLQIKELLNENLFSETMVNNILGAVAFFDVYDDQIELARINEQYYHLTGETPENIQMDGKKILKRIHVLDWPILFDLFSRTFKNQLRGAECDVRYLKKDGNTIWIHLRTFFLREQDNHKIFYGSISDVTTEKQKEEEFKIANKRLESTLRLAGINSWDWNLKKNTLSLINASRSSRLAQIHHKLGDEKALVVDFPNEFLKRDFVEDIYSDQIKERFDKIQKGEESSIFEVPFKTRNGETIWIRISYENVYDEKGDPIHAVGYYADISEQKKKELYLANLAKTDALTGLYNRYWAVPQIKDYLSTYPDEASALIMFDLDNFKRANDVYGHAYGDNVIIKTANVIKNHFRGQDIICRIGGDEFLVLCKNVSQMDIDKRIDEIVQSVAQSVSDQEHNEIFTVSSGYVMIPEQGWEFDDLYEKADMALYDAKQRGKNSHSKYHTDMKMTRPEMAEEADS